MSNSPLRTALIAAGLLATSVTAQAALTPVPLYLDVPVSDIGADNTLRNSNTSRKLAVAADGTIYALFRSPTNGIRIAKSQDRGQSFDPSAQIAAVDGEAEIAIASDGDLHVTWIAAGNAVHAVSRDGAATFSTPVIAGSATSAHMAVDGDAVYIVPASGSHVYRSLDDGASFTSTALGGGYAFADIFFDPLSHDVIVVADNPDVSFYTSTDTGQSFTAATATGKSVFYSVGALSANNGSRYVFMAGSNTNLERIEIDTPAYATTTVNATAGSSTRSLSADVFGNVVSGYLEIGTNNLKFEHSNDLGVTFGAPTQVVADAQLANAAINTVNGDILFLYEKANQIYLSTYERALIDYDVTVSPSALNFGAIEAGTQSSLPVTLTNISSTTVALGAFAATGGFSISDDCGGSIAASASCTVTVTFSPAAAGAASGTAALNLGSTSRVVPLSGSATPPRAATATALSASATEALPGEDITLIATLTGSALTGTVDFTEGGMPIPSCTGVALAGTQASCEVTDLTAGLKQYAAIYSGDVDNTPSTSAPVAVNVRQLFSVAASAGAGGSINPAATQMVPAGERIVFNISPASGYHIASVAGCGGSLSGSTFTTGAIANNCAVSASFALTPVNENVNVTAKSKGGGGSMGWPTLLLGALAVFARRSWPLLASVLVIGRASAEEPRWYAGATFGNATGEVTGSRVNAQLEAQGFTGSNVRIGDKDRDAYRVFAGYRFTPHWTVEAAYTDLGDVKSSASASVPVGQAAAYANALIAALPVAASGYEASVSYRYPFTQSLAASVRAGVWKWESEQRAVFGNQRVSITHDGTDALYGVGADWSFGKRWSLGLEAARYLTDREDFDLLAANIKFAW